jgi:hypothetical protein
VFSDARTLAKSIFRDRGTSIRSIRQGEVAVRPVIVKDAALENVSAYEGLKSVMRNAIPAEVTPCQTWSAGSNLKLPSQSNSLG